MKETKNKIRANDQAVILIVFAMYMIWNMHFPTNFSLRCIVYYY